MKHEIKIQIGFVFSYEISIDLKGAVRLHKFYRFYRTTIPFFSSRLQFLSFVLEASQSRIS